MANVPQSVGISDISFGQCFDALDKMAAAEQQYLTACEFYYESPSLASFEFLKNKAFHQAVSSAAAANNLSIDVSLEDFLKESLNLIKVQDSSRVAAINSIVGRTLLSSINTDTTIPDDLDKLDATEQHAYKSRAITFTANLLTDTLIADTDVFVDYVLRRPVN